MKFTIGVPVTRVKYLGQTLRSIAEQTVSAAETIVIDNRADGDVAATVAGALPAARIVRNAERLPPVANWNRLLAEVRTDWFILLSDDDFFAPLHLQQLGEIAARHPRAAVLHTRVRLVDADGKPTGLTPHAAEWESAWDYLWHRAQGYRMQFLSDFAWQTEALRETGGFADLPSGWATDDLTVFRVALRGGIGYSRHPTVNYRMHPASISSAYAAEDKLVAIRRLMDIYTGEIRRAIEAANLEADELLVIGEIRNLLPRVERRMQRYVLARTRFLETCNLVLRSMGGRRGYNIHPAVAIRCLLERHLPKH